MRPICSLNSRLSIINARSAGGLAGRAFQDMITENLSVEEVMKGKK